LIRERKGEGDLTIKRKLTLADERVIENEKEITSLLEGKRNRQKEDIRQQLAGVRLNAESLVSIERPVWGWLEITFDYPPGNRFEDEPFVNEIEVDEDIEVDFCSDKNKALRFPWRSYWFKIQTTNGFLLVKVNTPTTPENIDWIKHWNDILYLVEIKLERGDLDDVTRQYLKERHAFLFAHMKEEAIKEIKQRFKL